MFLIGANRHALVDFAERISTDNTGALSPPDARGERRSSMMHFSSALPVDWEGPARRVTAWVQQDVGETHSDLTAALSAARREPGVNLAVFGAPRDGLFSDYLWEHVATLNEAAAAATGDGHLAFVYHLENPDPAQESRLEIQAPFGPFTGELGRRMTKATEGALTLALHDWKEVSLGHLNEWWFDYELALRAAAADPARLAEIRAVGQTVFPADCQDGTASMAALLEALCPRIREIVRR